jgi:hypothetical protein
METCSSEFVQTVSEIEGLTDFRPGCLPDWFREGLSRDWNEMSDEELVKLTVGPCAPASGAWLSEWGSAAVNGRPVFVFTTVYLTDPVCLAADWQIGVTFLEPSERYGNEYFVAYFFEHGRRPVSDDVAVAGVKPSLATAFAE